MRNFLLVLVIASVTLLSACQPVSVEQAQTDFCADLQAYKAAVDNLSTLDGTSTVEQGQEAMKAVTDARGDLNQSARIMADANVDALNEAYDNLDSAIRDVSSSDTISDAVTSIGTEVKNVDAAYDSLYDVSCK